jgi:hypothetical protein
MLRICVAPLQLSDEPIFISIDRKEIANFTEAQFDKPTLEILPLRIVTVLEKDIIVGRSRPKPRF